MAARSPHVSTPVTDLERLVLADRLAHGRRRDVSPLEYFLAQPLAVKLGLVLGGLLFFVAFIGLPWILAIVAYALTGQVAS